MAKDSIRYTCSSCGAVHLKWMGRCTTCGAWSSLTEEAVKGGGGSGSIARRASANARNQPLPVSEIPADRAPRIPIGIAELDRVLGGGAVPGGAVLVGGDPGVGKSTLLLQAVAAIALHGPALYVSGEEGASQVALRARRLGVGGERLLVLSANEIGEIEDAAKTAKPRAMVVDSVQTVREGALGSPAGTVTQLREVTMRLVELAQREAIAMFLVGHVTKDGALAGPKVLEHLVDTVLSFEGERGHSFRALRVTKNRFGSATEVGLFEMTAEGMREVTQPSALFLAERPRHASGSVVAATAESARSLLVEVQALVGAQGAGAGRRSATGVDGGRLAMLLAVLARRCGVEIGGADVFVNVAGGMRIDEPALDLPMALAIASSFRGLAFPADTAVFGEVGLSGEVRGVPRAPARVAEARAMGFSRVLVPASSAERLTREERDGIELTPVKTLDAALDALG